MNKQNLSILLDRDIEYYLVETQINIDYKTKDYTLYLIALPRNLKNIKFNKTIDDITYKEVLEFEDTEIETNLCISDNYAPFQTGLRLLCDFNITGLSNNVTFITKLLLDNRPKRLYEATELIKNSNVNININLNNI
jgi:hypothetical protein